MQKVRITRFPHHTRYSVLVPNEQHFNPKVIKRIARTTIKKQELAVQLPLPFSW